MAKILAEKYLEKQFSNNSLYECFELIKIQKQNRFDNLKIKCNEKIYGGYYYDEDNPLEILLFSNQGIHISENGKWKTICYLDIKEVMLESIAKEKIRNIEFKLIGNQIERVYINRTKGKFNDIFLIYQILIKLKSNELT